MWRPHVALVTLLAQLLCGCASDDAPEQALQIVPGGFQVACLEDADCDGGLSCADNMCTRACQTDEECVDFPAASCAGAHCAVECRQTSDCAEPTTCHEEICVSCRPLRAYPVQTDGSCLLPAIRLTGVCLIENSPGSTTNTGPPACLVAPDGSAFMIGKHGYSERLNGDGWHSSEPELSNGETDDVSQQSIALCDSGESLIRQAYERCSAQARDEFECESRDTFSPALVEQLPLCSASEQ